jgi:hypothetical protein
MLSKKDSYFVNNQIAKFKQSLDPYKMDNKEYQKSIRLIFVFEGYLADNPIYNLFEIPSRFDPIMNIK